MYFRLTDAVDSAIQAMRRYHGDLSRFVNEALLGTNLQKVQLISEPPSRRGPGMTAQLRREAAHKMREAASQRGCSMVVLLNSALEDYLSKQKQEL